MRHNGIDVSLFTSDGPWLDMLENGSIKDIALPTINCGSDIQENFRKLQEFHGKKAAIDGHGILDTACLMHGEMTSTIPHR